MKRLLSGAVAAAAVACLPGLAKAEDPAAPKRPKVVLFEQLDANKDGQVSKDELPAEKQSLFEHLIGKADADKNGKLSATEFAQALEDQEKASQNAQEPGAKQGAALLGINPKQFFKRLDANGDGSITADEVKEPARPQFEKALQFADANGDGAISQAELTAGIEKLKANQGSGLATGGKPGAGGDNPVAVLKRLDVNADGKVTEDEVPAENKPRFANMLKNLDKNGDSAISLEEAQAAKTNKAPKAASGDNPVALLKRLDVNADGKVTEDEVPQENKPRFDNMLKNFDKNGDGAISLEEAQAAKANKAPKAAGGDNPVALLKRLDVNADGKVTEDEVPSENKPRFANMLKNLDKDGDGAISLEEAQAAKAAKASKEPKAGASADSAQQPNPRQLVRRLMNTDKDGDGKLAQGDLPKWLQEKFSQLDADQDGFVTKPELGKHAVELQALVQKRQQETKKGSE